MSTKSESGFTLVEITVAIVLLVTGLTTLLGLQSRVLDSYYVEYQRGRAALFAKYLMTIIEVSEKLPAKSTKEESLYEALDRVGYFKGLEANKWRANLDGWRVSTEVTEPKDEVLGMLAGMESLGAKGKSAPKPFMRIQLKVIPAGDPRGTAVLTYYLNPPDDDEDVVDPEENP